MCKQVQQQIIFKLANITVTYHATRNAYHWWKPETKLSGKFGPSLQWKFRRYKNFKLSINDHQIHHSMVNVPLLLKKKCIIPDKQIRDQEKMKGWTITRKKGIPVLRCQPDNPFCPKTEHLYKPEKPYCWITEKRKDRHIWLHNLIV